MNGSRLLGMPAFLRRPAVFLSLAALIIVSLCLHKVTRTYDAQQGTQTQLRPAPLCTLYDQRSQLMRLERYIGRHPILLVFFDGQSGADQDPLLRRAAALHGSLSRSEVIVIGISQVIPQVNRQALAKLQQEFDIDSSVRIPVQLLSDLDYAVHRQWQRFQGDQPRPATFLIDRAGRVAWQSGAPQPVLDPVTTLNQLLNIPSRTP